MRRKISLDEIHQTIDLSKIFGREPTASERRAFADEAIERIIDRTQSGIDRNGRSFTRYSEEYAEQKGVSRGDVDMTLFGDMLLSVDAETDSNSIKIFIPSDEVPKSYNHITGDTVPKRDWFGITDSEARAIADRVKVDIPVRQEIPISDILRFIGLVAEDDL